RAHQRANPRGCDLRSADAQRPPARAKGTVPPQPEGEEVGPLTYTAPSLVTAAIAITRSGRSSSCVFGDRDARAPYFTEHPLVDAVYDKLHGLMALLRHKHQTARQCRGLIS